MNNGAPRSSADDAGRSARLAGKLPFKLHLQTISLPRVERLTAAIARLAPRAESLLDVGCGDGRLVTSLAERLGVRDVRGVDVKLQPGLAFDARAYDGRTLPFDAGTFDLVTICDVLHHADDPLAVLRESLRVVRPGGAVVIKDHLRLGAVSNAILLAMDVVGNYAQGIIVTGKYLSPTDWVDVVRRAGGSVDELLWPFDVHPWPVRLVTRSEYQFLARVVPRHEGAR